MDMELLRALFALYPVEMALLCALTVVCSAAFGFCLVALIASYMDTGEEDELWEN